MKTSLLFLFVVVMTMSSFSHVIHIPDDYPTIQQGIDAASAGDTILVSPGTYIENIYVTDNNLTIGSLFLTTNDPDYIDQTTIDGGGNGTVINIGNENGQETFLTGFTITNGAFDEPGGGISIAGVSTTLTNL